MQSTLNGIVPGADEPVSDKWRKFMDRAVRFPTGMALLLLFAAALANSQLQPSEVFELWQEAALADGDRDADRPATLLLQFTQQPGRPANSVNARLQNGFGRFAVPSFTNARALMDTATSISNASNK